MKMVLALALGLSGLSSTLAGTVTTVPCLMPLGTLSLSVTFSQALKSFVRMAPYRCFL